jgi:S1-C subfamily serine protease
MSYYLRFRGKIFGPFDSEQLKDMKTKRSINKNSEISENKVDWFPAGLLTFLFSSPPAPQTSSIDPISDTMLSDWFYSVNGAEGYGPVTQSSIIQLIQSGTLHARSYIWQEGQNAQPISTIQPFAEYFNVVLPPSNGRNKKNKLFDFAGNMKLLVSILTIVIVIVVGIIVFFITKNVNLASLKEQLPQVDQMLKPSGKKTKSIEDAISKNEPSVAVIKGSKGHGTGFLIRQGILVTNKHVIDDQILELSTVYFPSAEKESRKKFLPKLLYKDPDLDLAFLQVETQLPALSIAEKHQFKRGEEVVAIGNPGVGNEVMEIAVNKGIMSSETSIDNHTFYQLGISINAGNSGGPAINQAGEVIGIVTLKARTEKGIEGIAFCIPSHDILKSLEVMEKLDENEKKINSSRHRARVAIKWMAEVDLLFRICMDKYIIALYEAYEKKEDLYEAIREEKEKTKDVRDKIQYFFLDVTEKELTKVMSDSNLSEAVRKNIKDYYVACINEKKFIDNPLRKTGTTISDVLKQKKELEEKCESLLTPLLMELGILRSEILD